MMNKTQKGFSLVELMVAVVISLFLIAGVVQVYISNKSTYRFGEAMSRLQENGRFALEYMATEIRMADFWGCANMATVQNNLVTTAPGYIDYTAGGIIGVDNPTGTPDEITINGAIDRGLTVQPPYMPNVSAAIFVLEPSGLAIDDVILVSDCLNGDIFQITNLQQGTGANSGKESAVHNSGTGTIGNLSNNLSKTYKGDASIYVMNSKRFTVENNGQNVPALFVRENGGPRQELVDHVQDMQILYGEDTNVPGDGVPNRYVTRGAVGDMEAVTAIRIMLLLRSGEDNVLDAPQTYSFNGGAPVTAADRRLRQVYTATINIRNRTR